MDSRVHFCFPWHKLDHFSFRHIIREYLDNGIDRFEITDPLLKKMLAEPEEEQFVHQLCKEMNVHFSMVHGLFGTRYDLSNSDHSNLDKMFQDHFRAMRIALDFGCRTYTVHIGGAPYYNDRVPLDEVRRQETENLGRLLEEAEKLGIIIAVENSFRKNSSAKEVLKVITPFLGSPCIGVCYDVGHASCMASFPGKDKNRYVPNIRDSWWEEEGIIFEENALAVLKDHIVVCHLHDNDGYGDLHAMPFDGIIDWNSVLPQILASPRLIDILSEVNMEDGETLYGRRLAPIGGYSIRKVAETFRKLGF